MGYKKILVDNPLCSRRFHVSFDPDGKRVSEVEIKCSYCGVSVFSAQDHPQAKLLREENLVKTAELSDNLVRTCDFRDPFAESSQAEPMYQR